MSRLTVLGAAVLMLSAISSPLAAQERFAFVTAENVDLMSEPSFDSEVLAPLPRGQRLQVLDVQGDWVRVLFETRQGFVHSELVTVTAGNQTAAAAGPASDTERPDPVRHGVTSRLGLGYAQTLYNSAGATDVTSQGGPHVTGRLGWAMERGDAAPGWWSLLTGGARTFSVGAFIDLPVAIADGGSDTWLMAGGLDMRGAWDNGFGFASRFGWGSYSVDGESISANGPYLGGILDYGLRWGMVDLGLYGGFGLAYLGEQTTVAAGERLVTDEDMMGAYFTGGLSLGVTRFD